MNNFKFLNINLIESKQDRNLYVLGARVSAMSTVISRIIKETVDQDNEVTTAVRNVSLRPSRNKQTSY